MPAITQITNVRGKKKHVNARKNLLSSQVFKNVGKVSLRTYYIHFSK